MRLLFLPLFVIFLIPSSFNVAFAQGLLAKASSDSYYFPVKSNNIIAVVGAFELEVELLKSKIEDVK